MEQKKKFNVIDVIAVILILAAAVFEELGMRSSPVRNHDQLPA